MSGAVRYVVREGKIRGEGRYFGEFCSWARLQIGAYAFPSEAAARSAAGKLDRVVRLVPKKTKGLRFEEALRAMRAGKCVRRPAWGGYQTVYIAAEGATWVFYETPDDRRSDSMSVSDILAGDWETVE